LLSSVIAGIGFGLYTVPVKNLDVADGIFFSFVMSYGIIIVGATISFVIPTERSDPCRTLPDFHPFAMLGGASWMIGNMMIPLIVKWLGMGVGGCVWATTHMLMGWATGMFGWFSVQKQPVMSELLNYTGLACTIVSLCIFFWARDLPEEQPPQHIGKSGSGAIDLDTEKGTGANTHIGMLFFGELRTSRARAIVAAGIFVRLVGIILLALSNAQL